MSTRIAAFTGSRADYGLLRPILTAMHRSDDFDLSLLVGGSHLSPVHGRTVQAIEEDGIPIAERLPSLVDDDTALGTSISLGTTVQMVAGALDRTRADLLLLLGDRWETLAAAVAATMANTPIAHLHGGETTPGMMDESLRHAITKLAHVHLVAATPFARRVEQMGEDPQDVHVVGAPGLDLVEALDPMPEGWLAAETGWPTGDPFLVVTHHPVTLSDDGGAGELDALLAGLDLMPEYRLLITAPNADPGSRRLRETIVTYVAADPGRRHLALSLGSRKYVDVLRSAAAVVGNSSSGIIEAPFVGSSTVNIGRRQDGRPQADSVVDVPASPEAIAQAVRDVAGRRWPSSSLYGDGKATERVLSALRATDLSGIRVKHFHDLPGLQSGTVAAHDDARTTAERDGRADR